LRGMRDAAEERDRFGRAVYLEKKHKKKEKKSREGKGALSSEQSESINL